MTLASLSISPAASPIPGLALTGLITTLALVLRLLPGAGFLSPLILAILLGVAARNLFGLPASAVPGLRFALQKLLRWGVVLLGLQLTLGQVAEVGLGGIVTIAASLAATFLVTRLAGRMLGVAPAQTTLIASGTAICGASAVIAVNAVDRAEEEDVAYAIAIVTIFGTLAMIAFPLIGAGMAAREYGLWTGSAIHEVAQVVAAGAQGGAAAAAFATIAKLTRVAFLAPMVVILSWTSGKGVGRAPFPWFVLGFVVMVFLASAGLVPPFVTGQLAKPLAQGLLAMGMAAMGLQTDLARLSARGLRPLALGAVSTIFLAGFSAALVFLTAGI